MIGGQYPSPPMGAERSGEVGDTGVALNCLGPPVIIAGNG